MKSLPTEMQNIKIASLSVGRTSRDVCKSMIREDSFNVPKGFKQVQNVKYNKSKKQESGVGKKNNFADEVLECRLK